GIRLVDGAKSFTDAGSLRWALGEVAFGHNVEDLFTLGELALQFVAPNDVLKHHQVFGHASARLARQRLSCNADNAPKPGMPFEKRVTVGFQHADPHLSVLVVSSRKLE